MKARQKGKQNRKFEKEFSYFDEFVPIPQELIERMKEILKKAEENIDREKQNEQKD